MRDDDVDECIISIKNIKREKEREKKCPEGF